MKLRELYEQPRRKAQIKSKRKFYVKELDKLHAQYIRTRDKRCVTCGETNPHKLQCGHLFSRTAYSTRWDIAPDGNCHCQCAGCNILHEQNFYPFSSWYEKRFGKERLERLQNRWFEISKLKDHDLEIIYENIWNAYQKLIGNTPEGLVKEGKPKPVQVELPLVTESSLE